MQIWEEVKGVLTPGGEPCYRCPECGWTHCYGVENPISYYKCLNCGEKLVYPWQYDVKVVNYKEAL